ncbi:hypothetical protein Amal_03419 [Acetobacter malorum]|uniref:Uncharacterized protein n=1 Tax=Acetobacter malorum TaxID=178901 RepID=A0A177G530_9PROT|nr:hypothetical protein Amal_03419 [Acetobacter malorum]
MQHGGDADARAQMPGIGGDHHHGLRGSLEQQGVENGLVLKRDVGDPCRQGEDDMEIPDRQQIGLPFGQPCPCGVPLAARTMAVATTVIGNAPVSAVPTGRDMATQGCRATVLYRRHDLELL